MDEYFIDRDGERRRATKAIAEWRGAQFPSDQAVVDFLIHTLGCVRFQIKRRACHVFLDWDKIADEAAVGLVFALHDYIEEFDGAIFIEAPVGVVTRLENERVAVNHVIARMRRWSARARKPFERHSVPLSATSLACFRDLARLCSPYGTSDVELVRTRLRSDFANRYCVVEPSGDSERLLLAEFGNGYCHIDDQFDTRRVGTPFGEFKNADYSRFTKSAYEQVWRSWTPTLEAIEIKDPTEGLPAQYYRALLPMFWSNRRVLLSTSLPF
ncbi:MAG: hypothetical protein JSS20_04235 [Proteobacteria bacterium]|nr:hypothetical protein [Pseudomonadota bacterium]